MVAATVHAHKLLFYVVVGAHSGDVPFITIGPCLMQSLAMEEGGEDIRMYQDGVKFVVLLIPSRVCIIRAIKLRTGSTAIMVRRIPAV